MRTVGKDQRYYIASSYLILSVIRTLNAASSMIRFYRLLLHNLSDTECISKEEEGGERTARRREERAEEAKATSEGTGKGLRV